MVSFSSASFAESAERSAPSSIFLGSAYSYERGFGPWTVPPWRHSGERIEPTRARPVPFCRQSLRPAPLTSLLSLVLCVPARNPRRYHREASCSRCGFTLAPNTASASSTCPTFLPSRLTTSTTGIISLPFPDRSRCSRLPPLPLLSSLYRRGARFLGVLGAADENVRAAGARHRAAHQQQILVVIHFHHFQIFRRQIGVAHVPRKMLVLPHPGGKRTAANAARRAMEHRAVRGVAAAVVPALHAPGKAFAFGHTADIHQLAGLEILYQHTVAYFRFVFRFLDAHFLQHFHRRHAGFFEMSGHGFVHPLRLDEFHQTQLRGFVAVLVRRPALHHHARSRLQHGAAHQRAVVGEDLRHPQLDSDNSVDRHLLFSLRTCVKN